MIEMAVTGPGQGLSLISLSRVMRIATMNAEIKARPVKAWEMTL